MSETKFTPGPWSTFWERDEEKFVISLPGKDDPNNYVCLAMVGGDKRKVGRPNANLIAAAPDLYAAAESDADVLDDLRMILESGADFQLGAKGKHRDLLATIRRRVDATRGALARARGES